VVAATRGIALLDGLVDAESGEGVDVEGYSGDDGVRGKSVMLANEAFSPRADDRVLFSSLYSLK
jgi:hypothetical protein